jgi:hypothetical protein
MVTPFNPFPKLIGVVNPGPWAIYFRDSKPNKNGTLWHKCLLCEKLGRARP